MLNSSPRDVGLPGIKKPDSTKALKRAKKLEHDTRAKSLLGVDSVSGCSNDPTLVNQAVVFWKGHAYFFWHKIVFISRDCIGMKNW